MNDEMTIVAADILSAVEPGILPGGKASRRFELFVRIPNGMMPSSTAGPDTCRHAGQPQKALAGIVQADVRFARARRYHFWEKMRSCHERMSSSRDAETCSCWIKSRSGDGARRSHKHEMIPATRGTGNTTAGDPHREKAAATKLDVFSHFRKRWRFLIILRNAPACSGQTGTNQIKPVWPYPHNPIFFHSRFLMNLCHNN